jgi:hypothetical protein
LVFLVAQAVPLQFSGRFFFPALTLPPLMQVYYGPASDPLRYVCNIVWDYTTSSLVTCMTTPDSSGVSNRFTVKVADQTATGTDLLDLPAFPVVLSAVGCPLTTANGTATADCPTGNPALTSVTTMLTSPDFCCFSVYPQPVESESISTGNQIL